MGPSWSFEVKNCSDVIVAYFESHVVVKVSSDVRGHMVVETGIDKSVGSFGAARVKGVGISREVSGAGELMSNDTAVESRKLGCDACDSSFKLSSCSDATGSDDSKFGTESIGIACNATDPGVPADSGAY